MLWEFFLGCFFLSEMGQYCNSPLRLSLVFLLLLQWHTDIKRNIIPGKSSRSVDRDFSILFDVVDCGNSFRSACKEGALSPVCRSVAFGKDENQVGAGIYKPFGVSVDEEFSVGADFVGEGSLS